MRRPRNPRRAAALRKVVHFMTAFTITMKAVSKLEHPQGYEWIIALFFAAAAYIVTITLLHDRLHAHERLLTASVYVIEAVVIGITAALTLGEGKRGIGSLFALASVMFVVATVVHLARTRGREFHPPEHV